MTIECYFVKDAVCIAVNNGKAKKNHSSWPILSGIQKGFYQLIFFVSQYAAGSYPFDKEHIIAMCHTVHMFLYSFGQ